MHYLRENIEDFYVRTNESLHHLMAVLVDVHLRNRILMPHPPIAEIQKIGISGRKE
jgi:hypothetical protein